MKIISIHNLYSYLFLFVLFLIYSPSAAVAQCEATTLQEFFDCYGGTSNFSTHSRQAVSTFIQAEDAINTGNYQQAKTLIEDLFATYPQGSNLWWNIFNDPNGANIGTPHAYYGLRMIEDIVDHHLNGNPNVVAQKAVMNVVMVGCSEGVQPSTESELQNGTGTFVKNTIDPALRADDYRIVKQSFDFFSQYVTAITGGQLEIELNVLEVSDLCLPVSVSRTKPYFAYNGISPVWDAISEEVKSSTDWWWIIYPSHVPKQADFDDDAFITGGMGLDQKGGPAFIVDDKWIVRKPAHLGDGDYSDIERRIYLPQWFQHEFFHHLYRAYPELRLEVNGHDWFNRNFWAADFEGQFEADYYAETLHKRIQEDCVPMATKLRTRLSDNIQQQFTKLSMEELLGTYSLDNIQNDWHTGNIIKQNNRYYWRNKANVQWEVTPNLTDGKLETGGDSPYPGKDFFIELYQTIDGDYIPGVTALKFQGELYKKRFNSIRNSLPIEIALGDYERASTSSPLHEGEMVKEAGQFYWENKAGDRWLLSPDYQDEAFDLNNDSPTPDQDFQLILIDDECGSHVLGFQYAEEYYWRPKRDLMNESPRLINAIDDLALQENFGTYSIDLSEVFADPEDDVLLLFASSSASGLLSSSIEGQQLMLSGGELGDATIQVIAVDANGGLAMDEFTVQVQTTVANQTGPTSLPAMAIYPNPTRDYISIVGAPSHYNISLFSADKSFRQEFSVAGPKPRIDIGQLSPGLYLIQIRDLDDGSIQVRKVIKY